MANAATLAAARERKSQSLAKGKAKGIVVPTTNSSLLSTTLSLSDSEQPLYFPDSPRPMATPSDEDLPSSISLPLTSLKRKSGSRVLSDDESNFTPVPAKKKRGHLQKAQSDSEVEEMIEKPPRKKPGPKPKSKAVPKAKPMRKSKAPVSDAESIEMVEAEQPPPPSVVLMVPKATSEGSQRLSINTTMSFEDALELIHETIGCVSVAQKPTLAYKLSTAIQKSATINLRTKNDWSGLVTDVMAKAKTKKDVSIVISVFPDNYMLSLRAMIKKKKPTATTKKKGKMTIMDLNNDDSVGEDDDDEGVADGEKKAMAELDAEYRKCMRCGPTYVCKIDRSGVHVHLSFNQCHAWAVSLWSAARV
ncbi:hypothetical protein K438DRAFT_979548 [Mycena galopus ATCC 62051]|nr:hypothetical protein K438DRAFT_979548 [Mycena galopus ATCC 62051]